MHRVVVLALPRVVLFDLAIPLQVFGHRAERRRYQVEVAAEGELTPSTTGVAVTRTVDLTALAEADTVVVPGYDEPVSPAVVAALRAAHDRGARLVSICVGAFALAEAGLLARRRATTHWHEAAELARYPGVEVDPDVLYVDAGQVLTSAGLAAGIDLCLHVYRLDHGAEAAAAVARRMVVAPHRDGGQAQLLTRPVPSGGRSLSATCAWAVQNLHEPLDVPRLAAHAHVSTRTLARRFVAETGLTPGAWVTAQRLLLARRLLETSDDGVDAVAHRSGLGTAANLRVLLHRDAGVSPSAYRAAFRGRAR